ncbi:glycoside hydrolase family 31 protein [Sphingomonas sp. AR_OL41]|uniref:glycoside hydrolase family 31 protein n=1 Tax=Sphingomonas sp. AR_OL41 TaxID=3042729 RepID=UPI0024812BAB|nr:glycoside hydrolase family 31 protein [Sphingomonas sp. AR_OL41]MDH7972882.1 glycoside hydrolase family 31 protein [Sphingomonas sp. AR_OL41]
MIALRSALARVIGVALMIAPPAVSASTVDHYTAAHDGVTIEISAPRADIVRIRAGSGALPEDASWAVVPDQRRQRVPLERASSGDDVVLRTSALAVTLDPATLAVTVRDRQGRVLLADAPGKAIAFARGGFRLRKAMPADAHFFGLGDKAGPLDRRGGAYTLWNTDQFGFSPSTDPLYKAIPFVLGLDGTGHAFGLFMDNSWRSFFDFGKSERAAFSFGAEGGPVDYYVMAGPGPKDVVQQYAWLTGKPPLTPRWALGFQQSRWSYMSQAEAQGIADRLRADRIPADVLWLDIDYQDRNRPFTVNTGTFPDLPGLVRRLKAQDMHLVVITDLHIANAPHQNYTPYDSGIAADVFMKRPDGTAFVGPVWPGPALFPDFTQQRVRAWWGTQYRDFVAMGVAGFWNDMNEPAVFEPVTKTMPLDVVNRIEEPGFAPRMTTQAEVHNLTGMLNARATYEGVLKLAPDRRPFVMTRASFAGGQRYAATWTGDNSSSWAHLNLSVSQLVSLGLSGFAYAGDDIGGFAGDPPSPELLTRWIEIGAFNPIFRDHYQKGKAAQEVWVHGTAQEDIRRRYIEERYRLMPYIYGLADENSRTGLPLMRPVFLEHPLVVAHGDRLGGTEGQFMLGADLLIAPPTTWESPAPYRIALPGTGWYDYRTGLPLAAAETSEMPTLDRLPVFVRPGAILPRQPLVQSTAETPSGRLQLAVYPGADCRGALYLDDGESFAYRTGGYLRQQISCDAQSLSFGKREGRFMPWWTGFDVVIHGWTGGKARVRLAGREIAATVDAEAQTLRFALPDIAHPARIAIER